MNLGYRKESELDDWKKFDIIESPKIISMKKNMWKKNQILLPHVQRIVEKCSKYDDPTHEDLLKNVI